MVKKEYTDMYPKHNMDRKLKKFLKGKWGNNAAQYIRIGYEEGAKAMFEMLKKQKDKSKLY